MTDKDIEAQALEDILNAPCGRCGDPTCFGNCEIGADDGEAKGEGTP